MKQLSGSDLMFLQQERGNKHMHVASLALYDPSTAEGGGVRFKDVLRFFASRLEQFPQFRRRLVEVPLHVDRPYWVEDASFDVEFHVRHIALPQPGDWRQLCIQVARLHARPLDRSKPLWEAYVIEGLQKVPDVPPGGFALYLKMHHAVIDGESASELLRAMHSLVPEPMDFDAEGAAYPVADREPTVTELYSRALAHGVERLPRRARFTVATVRRLASVVGGNAGTLVEKGRSMLPQLRGLLRGDLGGLASMLWPATRFTGQVSSHRVFEAVGLPLAEFRAVRKQVPEATINDLFLAIVGGALNKYLGSKGELPEKSIVAGVPLSLRGADKGGDRGNQVGVTFMSVHSDIADPLERLRAVCQSSEASKQLSDEIGKELLRDLLDNLPLPVTQLLSRSLKMSGPGLVVSNVRGPDVPLYMAGARLVSYVPVSIVVDGVGLNVTGFSYAGTMRVCAISCREMLPDPAFFADCLRESFEEIRDAAAREAAPATRGRTAEARAKGVEPRPALRRKGVNGQRTRAVERQA